MSRNSNDNYAGKEVGFDPIGEPESVSQGFYSSGIPDAEFLLAVINAVPARLAVIDADGFITAANKVWRDRARALGKPKNHPIGFHLTELLEDVPGRHGQAILLGYQAVLDGRRDEYSCTYPVGRAGEADWFKQTVSRVPGDGPIHRVVVIQSVQELKRSEQRLRDANTSLRNATAAAKDAERAKASFLATMSHELRTPLNGVLGMAASIARSPLPDQQRQSLQIIQRSGEALMTLIDDLLELSTIGAGPIVLNDGVVDVQELLDSAERVFAPLALEKGLMFTATLDPACNRLRRGDPVRVRQILYKLLSNALKFTDCGSVAVRVSHDADGLRLIVIDTGIGIPGAKIAQIFEPFVQVDESKTRRFGGSGLGLAICGQLVALMHGEISVESVEGVGSAFEVRLPLTHLDDIGARQGAFSAGQQVNDRRESLRVLVAEDNETNQLVLQTLLAEVGIEPRMVKNGQEAFEAWKSGGWDVVLMDIQMPVLDGVSAARLIRDEEQRLGCLRTPIIAVTANAMDHHIAEYILAGMDGLVSKPINFGLLLEALDSALNADLQDD
jgi:signal transduction histidine kinase/CheY-like chemotaxis protein